jgi:hypothetical protein
MSDDDDLFGSDLEIDDGQDAKQQPRPDGTAGSQEPADDDLFGSDDDDEPGSEPVSDRKMTDAKPFRTPVKQRVFGPSITIKKTLDHIRIGGTGTFF